MPEAYPRRAAHSNPVSVTMPPCSPDYPNTNISVSTTISKPAVISGKVDRFGDSGSAIAGRML